jgi:1,4-dihydroxy-2-naphthoyl-CoA hydrolase
MVDGSEPRSHGGFERLYGLELIELGDDVARGRVTVRDELRGPHGAVHGAVLAAIAESLASLATGAAVARDGKLAIGLANQTTFLSPIVAGAVNAVAVRRHAGRTTWIWQVEASDDDGRLCALTRVTIAVRER